MSKGEKFFQVAVMVSLVLLIGVIFGYGWRMYHEPLEIPAGIIYLPDLSHEIGKGKEFWLLVDDDCMLHFLPLRKAQYEMAIRREKR